MWGTKQARQIMQQKNCTDKSYVSVFCVFISMLYFPQGTTVSGLVIQWYFDVLKRQDMIMFCCRIDENSYIFVVKMLYN